MRYLKSINEYNEQDITSLDTFKNWFKDSRVIDKRGNPLVVYHGSEDIRGIKTDYIFKTNQERILGIDVNKAYYFTDSYSKANSYTKRWPWDYQEAIPGILNVYLSIQNPLIIDAGGNMWRKFETEIEGKKLKGTKDIVEFARLKNYDGVIIKNVLDYYNNNDLKVKVGNVYVTFSQEQIKLADGTNTTFDSNNPDIRK